jgi:preprotein translocase subunit SecE
MNLTGAVIVMTVALAAFLGLIDAILNWAIKPIIGSG